MNKKLILLALPALLLSGCNKEISAADAKVKAKEIAEHEVKAEDVKTVSITVTGNTSAKGKSHGETHEMTSSSKSVVEFSYEDKFVHVFTASSAKMDAEEESYESEAWFFVKDSKFTMATRILDEGKETKTTVSIPDVNGVGVQQFEAATKKTVENLVEELHNKEFLEEIQEITDGKVPEGVAFEVKYFTSGDGNLTVEGKETFTDYLYQGYKGSGDGTVKYAWNNYLMTEMSVTMNLKIVDAESDTDATYSVESTGKADYNYKVAYPDLTGYDTHVGE